MDMMSLGVAPTVFNAPTMSLILVEGGRTMVFASSSVASTSVFDVFTARPKVKGA